MRDRFVALITGMFLLFVGVAVPVAWLGMLWVGAAGAHLSYLLCLAITSWAALLILGIEAST